MKTRKNNKRALIVSMLSLLLCVSMLVGTTFAWFTDNAATKVNTIQAGTLDIGLYDNETTFNDDTSLEGKTLSFVTVEGAAMEDILFEPGAKFRLQNAWLRNDGNLHVKYQVVISGIDGSSELAKVLDVYVNDANVGTLAELVANGGIVKTNTIAPEATDTFGTIELMMQTTAGNEYQGKSLSGIAITVNATQAAVESDSFGNTYDEKAEFKPVADKWDGTVEDKVPEESEDGTIVINTAAEFAAFAASVNAGDDFAGKTVTLNTSIDLANLPWTSISSFAGTFDGQGNTISNLKDAALFGTVAETGVLKNVNIKDASITGVKSAGFLVNTLNGKLNGCTVKNTVLTTNIQTSCVGGMVGFSGVTAVIENCSVDGFTFTNTNTGDNGDKVGGLVGQSSGSTIKNSSVSNITLSGIYKTKEWGGFVGRHANEGLIENCTATNVKINVSEGAQSVGGFVGATANATIKGCNANGVTITDNNSRYTGWIGGFVGYTGGANWYVFEDCHVTGLSVTESGTDESAIGGFSGRAAFTTTIKNCSAEGVIDANDASISAGLVNELIGQNYPRTEEDGGLNPVVENNTTNVTIK